MQADAHTHHSSGLPHRIDRVDGELAFRVVINRKAREDAVVKHRIASHHLGAPGQAHKVRLRNDIKLLSTRTQLPSACYEPVLSAGGGGGGRGRRAGAAKLRGFSLHTCVAMRPMRRLLRILDMSSSGPALQASSQ